MSSDMLTSMLASDVESESRTWKDRQDEIEQEFIETCHWRQCLLCYQGLVQIRRLCTME